MIIGGMKCGTTALFQALARHPRICASRQKEPSWFTRPEVNELGPDWYGNLYDWRPERHAWAMEASTSSTKLPVRISAAPGVNAAGVEARFIYLVRNPVARIRSE